MYGCGGLNTGSEVPTGVLSGEILMSEMSENAGLPERE